MSLPTSFGVSGTYIVGAGWTAAIDCPECWGRLRAGDPSELPRVLVFECRWCGTETRVDRHPTPESKEE